MGFITRISPRFLSSRLECLSEWPSLLSRATLHRPLCLGAALLQPGPIYYDCVLDNNYKNPPGQDLGFNVRTRLALCSQSPHCELTFTLIHFLLDGDGYIDGGRRAQGRAELVPQVIQIPISLKKTKRGESQTSYKPTTAHSGYLLTL